MIGRRQIVLLPALLFLPKLARSAEIALPRRTDSVKFAVIGDSGSGTRRQYETGKQLADARHDFPFEFVLMLGDNLYGGQRARDFFLKFEQPYRPLVDAKLPFYAALGNHDAPAIQMKYKPFNMDGRRFYTFTQGPAQFFALDSTYMSPQQLAWFEKELAASTSKWKIAFMHHPIYSSGKKHGSDVALRTFVEPRLQKYGSTWRSPDTSTSTSASGRRRGSSTSPPDQPANCARAISAAGRFTKPGSTAISVSC